MASGMQVAEDIAEVLVQQPVAFAEGLVKDGLGNHVGLVRAVRQRDEGAGDGVVAGRERQPSLTRPEPMD